MTALPPKPVPDEDTQPYWAAAAEHRLAVPRCGVCDRWVWQPAPLCPSCGTPDLVWSDVSGDGVVVSWTVIHPPVLPAWADEVPFTVLLVELDEGVRMVGRLVGADASELSTGLPVALRWRDAAGLDTPLPAWTPQRGAVDPSTVS